MIFKNQKGFTLPEIMIATGLLAALSLGVMSMMKNMQKGQVVSETKMEELELRRLITTLLIDQVACQNTLGGTNIGTSISQIKNNANVVAFQTNNTYGNNSVKITSMSTQDLGIVNADGTRTINLNLALTKMKQLSGGGTKNVSIQLNVSAPSANGTISKCFVDSNQIISTANQTGCASLGGTWNGASSTCYLGNYVNKNGDTMTGTLNANVNGNLTGNVTGNVTGNISGANGAFTTKVTSPQFCTGANCKAIGDFALSNKACANGYAQIGVNADGTPNCKALQCPANQYFAGLDASSNAICRPYPTNTCPTNQYVAQVNADGTVVCAIVPNNATATCPAGQVLQSISAGVPTCVNKGAGTSCSVGQVVTAVASDGTVTCGNAGVVWGTCPAGQVMVGINPGGTIKCASSMANQGSYQLAGLGGCQVANNLTGSCSCPAGSSPVLVHIAYLNGFWSSQPDYMYECR
ncbi:MAG: prepilin-type N-terminal cleavage/methylation domain-containing protein [Bacteriovorax sp.]